MKKLKRTLGNVLFLLKPYWKYGKPIVLLSVVVDLILYPLFVAAETKIAQAIIEAAQSGRGAAHIAIVALSYLAVILVYWVCGQGQTHLYRTWKDRQLQSNLEREVYEQAVKTDFHYVDNPAYFDNYKQAVEKYPDTTKQTFELTINLIASVFVLATVIGIMAATSFVAVAIALGGIIIASIFRMRLNSNYIKMWEKETPFDRRMGYLTRLLYTKSANNDLRATNATEYILKGFDKAQDGYVNTKKSYRWKQFFNGFMMHFADQISVFLVLVYVAIGLVSGRIESVGVFTTLIAATQAMSGALRSISYYVTDLIAQSQYADKIRNFFELKSEIEPSTDGEAAPDGALTLELKNVSFAYPNSDFALRDISLTIKPNAKIAIVGENGTGKTTLSKLLLRLYDTDSGEILYNGKSIREYDIHALRRKIGVAFQEPQLYALTVRDNMQAYNSASDDELREALKTVGLDIDLDSEVTREFDENGVLLSGGQSQKLGLARLLIGDFGLLLLDEPSSALDPIAEYEMTRLMFEKSKTTTIMVAHRLSTIRYADRIYLIANGSVAEQGTHDELIALGGKYSEMFAKQAENYMN
ncbi:MAG: ABC transporter ATP-binding protein/permease [Oscillospiraceae bacterium]|jgi:ATP-binding cassette subfamily B protein|nr:ABC transporter ATP-binding protein/permease [Oscillospiraceae bacterium]